MSTSEASRDSETAALVDFVELFLEDRRTGFQRTLGGYLDRFPDHQDAIAREYLALCADGKQGPATDSETLSAEPTSGEGPLDELIARLRARPFQGQRLVDKGEIARGGMGAILRVWDEDLRREIAMKIALGKSPRLVASFIDEAQITSHLDHPGIVPVHDIGIDSAGQLYFSMRLVRGRELKQIIKLARANDEGWSLIRALDVILRVCEAMAYAHSKGVVHRDLKPANIMVGEFGEVYVMDWGLARADGRKDRHDLRFRDDHSQARSSILTLRREERESSPDSPLITMDGLVVGTPCYMSPEQARGCVDELGPRSDVYSVGAMLYELLTGQKPYIRPSSHLSGHTVLAMVLQGPPAPVHELDKTIPAELVAICEKAMSRTAEDRYQDTRAMARDLRSYLEQRVVSAYETGAYAEIKKWFVRNKLVAASLMAVLVSVSAGFVTAVVFGARAARNESLATQRASDVLSLATFHDLRELVDEADRLWPARTEMIPKYKSWLERARLLLEGREAVPAGGITRRLGLRDHKAKLAEIRTRSKPRTPEQIDEARRQTASYPEFERERGHLTWMQRMIGEIPWPAETDVEAALAKEALSLDANALNKEAWSLVDPDPKKIVYGNEVRGLVLARRAVAKATGDELARDRVTLAWALFRCGRFSESIAEAQRASTETTDEQQKVKLTDTLDQLKEHVALWNIDDARKRRASELSELSARVAELQQAVELQLTYEFDDRQDAWWHSQLVKLVADLETFTGTDTENGKLSSVERRLVLAPVIEFRSVGDPNVVKHWTEAIASIRNKEQCPQYDGLVIAPQIGLVPIGRDPQSGLWEFAHVQSGEIPLRDKTGKLELTESTSLVFVLIPAGNFLMGEQNTDVKAPHYIPSNVPPTSSPTQRMSLHAFFLSKYEMTQAQWQRFEGKNPSEGKSEFWFIRWNPKEPISLLHPVEFVSWVDCDRTMSRLGLCLPTEAQWEYAARAGTDSVWWTGDNPATCHGVINLFEAMVGDSMRPNMRDGYVKHAPVGTFPPNGFGLHEILGNVSEWCRDAFGSYEHSTRVGDGLRVVNASLERSHVHRGGSYNSDDGDARVAARAKFKRENARPELGVRPAMEIAK